MTTDRPAGYLVGQVRELCKLPQETEWAELKVNNSEPQEIGEYLSALANSAALAGKAFAYLVWGVSDGDHAIVGTRFAPGKTKMGNEELESWLLRLLTPKIHFRFFAVTVDGQAVVLLEIERAFRHPVQFQGLEYIRVGSYKKKLKDFPEKERALWRIFDRMPFEDGIAAERVSDGDVLWLLDCSAYFDLLARPLPTNQRLILKALDDDSLILPCKAGGWSITNLGAMLFAKRLGDFRGLQRKAVRVIQYRGAGRVETLKEQTVSRGYACGFEELIKYINGLLPSNLPARLLASCEPGVPDEHVRAGPVRDRDQKLRDRLPAHPGGRRGGAHRGPRPQSGPEVDALRAVLGVRSPRPPNLMGT